jgi:VIT1/CCC1 family predicted Fe2+/Mn2+ transporter
MPLPPPPIKNPMSPPAGSPPRLLKANNELLVKGVLCLLIGAGVLVSPYFITSPGMQSIVAQSSLVGWFAVVLGAAFVGLYARRRMAASAKP